MPTTLAMIAVLFAALIVPLRRAAPVTLFAATTATLLAGGLVVLLSLPVASVIRRWRTS